MLEVMDYSEAVFTVIHQPWGWGVCDNQSALSDWFLKDMAFCAMKKEVSF